MKKSLLLAAVCFLSLSLFAGTLVKTYHFGKALVKSNGNYQTVSFANTLLSGNGGEPMMPWASVSLILPPGESATSIHMQGSGFVELEGKILIQPQQDISPISKGDNEQVTNPVDQETDSLTGKCDQYSGNGRSQ